MTDWLHGFATRNRGGLHRWSEAFGAARMRAHVAVPLLGIAGALIRTARRVQAASPQRHFRRVATKGRRDDFR